jgi:hypothetical protein
MHQQNIFETLPPYMWQTLIFLNLTTGIIFYYLIKSDKSLFVQLYLLTMVIKLFAYAGYNVIIIMLDRENAGANVGFFLVTYLIFTTLELLFLYRKISN